MTRVSRRELGFAIVLSALTPALSPEERGFLVLVGQDSVEP
jgi:hypothetical protein